MKKFIAVLLILSVFAGSVFAAPVPVLKESLYAPTLTEDDLFADVQADALTPEEAAAVEGEGFWGALIGAVVGAVAVIVTAPSDNPPSTKDILSGAASGATLGWYLLPF